MNIPAVAFCPLDEQAASFLPPSTASLVSRPQRRLAQILAKGSATPPPADDAASSSSSSSSSSQRAWRLRFFLSPVSFHASPAQPDALARIRFERTEYCFDPNAVADAADSAAANHPFSATAKVRGTGHFEELPAAVAFRSIGYKAAPLPGLAALGVPFDARLGIVPNDAHGRVLAPYHWGSAGSGGGSHDSTSSGSDVGGDSSGGSSSSSGGGGRLMMARHVPGFYVAGWAKRGPTGVIASTMHDAYATADAIVQDWLGHARFLNDAADSSLSPGDDSSAAPVAVAAAVAGGGWEGGVKREADRCGLRRVSWAEWERIDAVERRNGAQLGKPREKIASVAGQLRVLD
jgi:adrenodoxin-NADP+ reductase